MLLCWNNLVRLPEDSQLLEKVKNNSCDRVLDTGILNAFVQQFFKQKCIHINHVADHFIHQSFGGSIRMGQLQKGMISLRGMHLVDARNLESVFVEKCNSEKSF